MQETTRHANPLTSKIRCVGKFRRPYLLSVDLTR